MTIEEAIEHSENTACRLGFTDCGRAHRQLTEWLKELKQLREDIQAIERLSDFRYEEIKRLKAELELTRWHYPDKGEVPTETGRYLYFCRWYDQTFVGIATYSPQARCWFGDDGRTWGLGQPAGWKPIKLPRGKHES